MFDLNDKYVSFNGKFVLSGIQAIVKLTLLQKELDRRAGLRTAGYVSGYRGSPLGYLDKEFLSHNDLLIKNNIKFRAAVNEDLAENDHITNIVLMGMGEPLDNYSATVDAVRLMVAPEALKVSTRKVTLSTAGQVDLIKKFQQEDLHVNLAISLNATDNETRERIMPINKKYPIEDLMECLRNYPLKPTRRLTFEYVLLRDINDRDEDARRLAKLLHGIPSKLNLIPFNSHPGAPFDAPHPDAVEAYQERLIRSHIHCAIRTARGLDIEAACGLLAGHQLPPGDRADLRLPRPTH